MSRGTCGATRHLPIIHTYILKVAHGSTHTYAGSWHRVVRRSNLWFIVPLYVCSAVFTDHSLNRSIRRRVSAVNMNNRLPPRRLLFLVWLRIPILSWGQTDRLTERQSDCPKSLTINPPPPPPPQRGCDSNIHNAAPKLNHWFLFYTLFLWKMHEAIVSLAGPHIVIFEDVKFTFSLFADS